MHLVDVRLSPNSGARADIRESSVWAIRDQSAPQQEISTPRYRQRGDKRNTLDRKRGASIGAGALNGPAQRHVADIGTIDQRGAIHELDRHVAIGVAPQKRV